MNTIASKIFFLNFIAQCDRKIFQKFLSDFGHFESFMQVH